MKQLCYIYPKQGVGYDEVPEKQIARADEVKIKIEYASICGSDMHQVSGNFDATLAALGVPEGMRVPLGHEAAGTVVEVGADVTNCKVGDKVTYNCSKGCGKCHFCRMGMEYMCVNSFGGFGGMCEYTVVPESNVFVLPEGITTRQACITEPTTIAMHAIEEAEIKIGDTVAVIGGGPIGMLVLQLAKMKGAGRIALFDVVEEKFKMGKALGADFTFDSRDAGIAEKAKAVVNGFGYDKVIECSGNLKALNTAMDVLSPGGKLVIASVYPGDAKYEISINTFILKDQDISGVYLSTHTQFEQSLKILHKIDFEKTITAEFTMDQYNEAFEAARNGKNVKVIFKVAE